MKRTYQTGLDTNDIQLAVTVGTVGVAYTDAVINRSGGQITRVAESDEQSGNLPQKSIGTAASVRGTYLVIRTIIDLSHIDPSQWANAKDKLVIRYTLSGGLSGIQFYNQDLDDINSSPNGKIIVVTKPIQLL